MKHRAGLASSGVGIVAEGSASGLQQVEAAASTGAVARTCRMDTRDGVCFSQKGGARTGIRAGFSLLVVEPAVGPVDELGPPWRVWNYYRGRSCSTTGMGMEPAVVTGVVKWVTRGRNAGCFLDVY